MATNFGPEATQISEVQSHTTVKDPVRKDPVLLEGMTDIFEMATGVLKGRKAAANEQVVADFITAQTKVADALDQGVPGMTQQSARTAHRKNFLQFLEAHPGLATELIKAQKDIIGTSGLGAIVDEGTKEEQRREAVRDALVSNGYVAPDATEEEFTAAEEELRIAENATRIHQERMRTLDMRKKQLDINSAEYQQNEREIAEANRQLITSTQPVRFNQMQNTFEEILSSPATDAEKVQAMENFYTAELAKISVQLGELTGQQSTYLTKPFEMMFEQYKQRATGELDQAELDRTIKQIEQTSKLLILQDPDMAKIIATSDLLGDSAFVQVMLRNKNIGDKISNLIAGHSEGSNVDAPSLYSTDESQKQAVKTYTEGALRLLQSDNPEAVKEGESRISKILESLVDDEGKIKRDPKAAFQAVKWIASPEFLAARATNPTLFDAEINDLTSVLTAHYYDEVMGMVEREFTENQVVVDVSEFAGVDGTDGRVAATDEITTKTTSSGMTFVTSSKDPQIKAKVRDLNKSLAPVINETVHAFAHLQGRSDYDAYWDEVSQSVLTGEVTTDEGDDLNVEDFQQQLESDAGQGTPVGSVSDAGAGYTVVQLEDGTIERRTGTRAWRNNNPGNIEYGDFAKSKGAVGSDGRFAVFNTYEEGRAAKASLIFESGSYKNKTLKQAIARYAPSFENNTSWYARTVAEAAGVSLNTVMSDMTPEQRKLILDAMEKVEGFKVGTVEKL